jgi:hypothetical protein
MSGPDLGQGPSMSAEDAMALAKISFLVRYGFSRFKVRAYHTGVLMFCAHPTTKSTMCFSPDMSLLDMVLKIKKHEATFLK